MKKTTLNQKGAVDMMFVVILIAVIGIGIFAYTRVKNNDNSVASTDVQTQSETIEEHIDPEKAVAVSDEEIISKEVTDLSDAVETPDITIDESIGDPIVDGSQEEQPKESPQETEPEEEDDPYASYCPTKGGPDKVTFYPSDYKQFDALYFGNVGVVKGGGYNCGITRMTTAVPAEYGSSSLPSISLSTIAGSLPGAVSFVENETYRACAEVRFVTSNPGFLIDTPDNTASYYMISTVGAGWSVHCKEFTYVNTPGTKNTISFRLSNKSITIASPTPPEGEEQQSVDINRVTIEKL